MKYKLISILLLISVSLSLCSRNIQNSEGVRDRRDLSPEITHLKGKVYLIEDRNYWKTNSLFYSSNEGIVFFDTSWTAAGANRIIWKAAATGRGDYNGIVLTDDRPFRSAALGEFERNRIPLLTTLPIYNRLRTEWEQYQVEMTHSYGSWIATPRPVLNEASEIPDELLEGKIKFIRINTAFTPGNFLVFFPEESILYGGSTLSVPLYFRERIDVKGYASTIEKIVELNPETIISGHGEAIRTSEFLPEFIGEIQKYYSDFSLPVKR